MAQDTQPDASRNHLPTQRRPQFDESQGIHAYGVAFGQVAADLDNEQGTSGDTGHRLRLPRQRCRPRRPWRKLTKVGQAHAAGYAAKPDGETFVCGSLEKLFVPEGFALVDDRARALALLDEVPEALPWGMQARAIARRRAIWQAIVEHLDPGTGVIVAVDELLAARATTLLGDQIRKPVSRSSVAAHRTALQAAGLLQILQTGASKKALGTDRNRAPSYAITGPIAHERTAACPVDKNWNLPEGSAPARTQDIYLPRNSAHFTSSEPRFCSHDLSQSEGVNQGPSGKSVLGRSRGRGEFGSNHSEKINPKTTSERLFARMWLSERLGLPIWRFALIDKELVLLTSKLFAAGWSAEGVFWALQYRPDGTEFEGPLPTPDMRDHPDQPRVRSFWALCTWRLKHWYPHGIVLDPPKEPRKPPRGRPRKPKPVAVPTPVAGPGPEATAAIATFRAHNTAQTARSRAAKASRAALADQAWSVFYERPSNLDAVYLRAETGKRDRRATKAPTDPPRATATSPAGPGQRQAPATPTSTSTNPASTAPLGPNPPRRPPAAIQRELAERRAQLNAKTEAERAQRAARAAEARRAIYGTG